MLVFDEGSELLENLFEFSEECIDGNVVQWQSVSVNQIEVVTGSITKILPALGLLTHLTRIHIERNLITEIPEEISLLTELTYVSFNGNRIAHVTDALGSLQKLNYLDLSNNQIANLPESLGNLTELGILGLGNNRLTGIPDVLKNCRRLLMLDLGRNQLLGEQVFPSEWESMKFLYLQNCGLTTLSDSIASLLRLEKLDLAHNSITELPNLKPLVRLKELNLSHARIPLGEIPSALRQVKSLCDLNVEHCGITKFPEWLGELKNLFSLTAQNNNISQLPPCFAELEALERLQISTNRIREIPKYVAALPMLRYMSVDSLKYFPPSLCYRTNPVHLSVNSAGMRELPTKSWCDIYTTISIPSLKVFAARKIGPYGKNHLGLADVPEPCLELIKSAERCSSFACKGVFVRGTGVEAVEHKTLQNGEIVALHHTICHSLCKPIAPKNRGSDHCMYPT